MTDGGARRSLLIVAVASLLAAASAGCRVVDRPDSGVAHDSSNSIGPHAATREAFRLPGDSAIPTGVLGASIRRGRALLNATRDSLPDHVGNDLRCTSCHLDDGLRANAIPWIGVYTRFPQYRARNDAVNLLTDRVNDCFDRSMNGTPIAPDGREMKDIVAYMAFLSRGYAAGSDVEGQGLRTMTPLTPDMARGARVFAGTCVDCHGADGQGTTAAPALWGTNSYNIGAGMARLRTAASFLRYNMPYGNPTLTDQQAYDVAAYVNSQSRPDFPGKEHDWPRGDAPPDAAYRTKRDRAGTGAGDRSVPRSAP